MGHISIVYGSIIGMPWKEDYYHLQKLNREVLQKLPLEDDYPWITRDMFNVPDPENIRGTYREQVIAFGASYKSIEHEWDEWLEKFEALLKTLFWRKVTMHLETELVGFYTYEWLCDSEFYLRNMTSEDPQPVTLWDFKGGPRKFEI